MSQRRCCDCAPGCEECYESNANTACCRLSPADVLMLKIERPAWSMPVAFNVTNTGSQGCPLPVGVSTRLEGSISYDAAEPLLVMYRKFNADSATGNGLWFAENGSFGCNGGTAAADLWALWPPLCPQPISLSGTPYPACCNNNCLCSAASPGPRTYIGPSDNYVSTSYVCSNADSSSSNNVNLTNFQKQIIDGNAANRTVSGYSNCSLCGGSTINATAICDYSGYEWLQGIYDDSVNATPRYRHFYWDAATETVAESPTLKPLAHTLVSVYHKEKWYKACEKYDGGVLSDECEQVSNWGCRVPEYWIYGCAGVPIFSWEIHEMYDAGKINYAEYAWFFRSQYQNDPLGKNATGKSLINKLENSHWYHPDGSGIGILQVTDWRGVTLPGTSTPVPTSETRLVRKDLARYTLVRGNLIKSVVQHQFYHARPGGWTHACYAPPKVCGSGGCSGELYTGEEITQQAPQIPRETGCGIAGGDCDYVIYQQEAQTPITTGQGCFTAAPFPQCSTCVPSNQYGACSVCGGCDDCPPPITIGCGGPLPWTCSQDIYRSSCDSIHFTHVVYWHDQTGNLDAEDCVFKNHAWLWAINEECEETDGTCTKYACPPGPVEQTPRENFHRTSIFHSLARLCNCISNATFCSGARHTIADSLTSPTWTCPGVVAKQPPNTDRDPGNPTKPPYTTDGCGQYLCNNETTDPLGACCVNDGTTTTCIDAVTQKQCEKCGQQTGYTSTWGGKNSCCLDTDLCGP